jgi:hypothetical protein
MNWSLHLFINLIHNILSRRVSYHSPKNTTLKSRFVQHEQGHLC